MKTALLSTTLAAAFCLTAAANNIQIANVAISDQDSVTKTANIGFDLSWENSWRLSTGPANWDAAWVFVKFHNGDNNWRHAKLAVSAAAHTVPAGATLAPGLTDGTAVGAFVHRSGNGSGNIAWTGLKLKWNYGADGVLDSAIVSVDVQAIEMVYVPQGAFYLGDGATETSAGRGFSAGTSRNQPYQVTSAGQLEIGNTATEITTESPTPSASDSIFPAILPNGFAPFYCMKYEVSQGQYARFSNMQAVHVPFNYVIGAPNAAKSRQRFTGSMPNFAAVTPDRAYGVSRTGNYYDLYKPFKAYLAWTGLRPMSEMEYQKACRGPVFPVAGEFAWGTAVGASLPYSLSGDGTPTEAVSTNYNINAGNAWTEATSDYWAINNQIASGTASTSAIGLGPCRVGMSARAAYTGSTSARIQAGASYWGIMDLTGNVSEPVMRCFTADRDPTTTPAQAAGNPDYLVVNGLVYRYATGFGTGRRFQGSHGNGTITSPLDWGGNDPDDIRFLGGNYSTTPLPVSAREGEIFSVFGLPQAGIRGVRSGS